MGYLHDYNIVDRSKFCRNLETILKLEIYRLFKYATQMMSIKMTVIGWTAHRRSFFFFFTDLAAAKCDHGPSIVYTIFTSSRRDSHVYCSLNQIYIYDGKRAAALNISDVNKLM